MKYVFLVIFSILFISSVFTQGEHIVTPSQFDAAMPLTGWTQPSNATSGDLAAVMFADGIGYYTFDGVIWVLDWFTTEIIQSEGGFQVDTSQIGIVVFTDTTSLGTIYQDTICKDSFWRANYFIYRNDTLNYSNFHRSIDCSIDSFNITICKDTIEGGYVELRTIPSQYICDNFYLQNWQLNSPDGNLMKMLGGNFRKTTNTFEGSLSDNGGTIIELADGTFVERNWDYITVQPEWWEGGGTDDTGVPYINKFTSGAGIYNEADRVKIASTFAGKGHVIKLMKDKIYELDIGISPRTNTTLQGNGATLKRANAANSSLLNTVTSGATSIDVVDASSFRVGQTIVIATGISNIDHSGQLGHAITNISGNNISIGTPLNVGMPAGANVFNVFNIIHLGSTSGDSRYEKTYVKDLVIDGNRANNAFTVSWLFNYAIIAGGGAVSHLDRVHFFNLSNECIIGGDWMINECSYDSIGSSFVHISESTLDITLPTRITNCYGSASHLNDNTLVGHGEGVITHSINVSDVEVVNCNFNSGDLVFGTMTTDDSEFKLVNSIFSNFDGICGVSTNGSNPDNNTDAITIKGCEFYSCGDLIIYGASIANGQGDMTSEVTIDNNTFYNSRFWFNGVGHLRFTNNRVLREDGLHGFTPWASPMFGEERALMRLINFDRVDISGNRFESPIVEDAFARAAIFFRVDNSHSRVIGDGNNTITDFYYPQHVNVSNNSISGFRFGIGFLDGDVFAQRNKAFVGWKFSDNLVYLRRDLGTSGRGYGINALPGIEVSGNSVWTYESDADAPGILGIGVHNPATGLRGPLVKNNSVYGPGISICMGSLLIPTWGQYGGTYINNYTTTAPIDNTNGNAVLTMPNYRIDPAGYIPEEQREFLEDTGDY